MNIQFVRTDGYRQPSVSSPDCSEHQAAERVFTSFRRVPHTHQLNSDASKNKEPARNAGIGKHLPACRFKAVLVSEPPLGYREVRDDPHDVV